VGTSAGSLVASSVALNYSPNELLEKFVSNVSKLFQTTWANSIRGMDSLFAVPYTQDGLRSMLDEVVKGTTLADITEKKIIITSFALDSQQTLDTVSYKEKIVQGKQCITSITDVDDIKHTTITTTTTTTTTTITNPISTTPEKDTATPPKDSATSATKNSVPTSPSFHRWKPVMFHNFKNSSSSGIKLVEACLHSGCAPTYFPINNGYVDGGMWANNPSLAGYSLAVKHGVKSDSVYVLSISTGFTPRFLPVTNGNWGIVQWGSHVVDLLMDGNSIGNSMVLENLLGDRMFRVDPLIQENISLDASDAKSIQKLKEIAENCDLTGVEKWIEKNFDFAEHVEKEDDFVLLPSSAPNVGDPPPSSSTRRSCNII